jgi:Prolipoprotein diacylglyceryltransferase
MYPVLFEIAGFQIRTYGVLVLLGFLTGVWFAKENLKKFGISENKVWDSAIWAMIFGIVGSRLFFRDTTLGILQVKFLGNFCNLAWRYDVLRGPFRCLTGLVVYK